MLRKIFAHTKKTAYAVFFLSVILFFGRSGFLCFFPVQHQKQRINAERKNHYART